MNVRFHLFGGAALLASLASALAESPATNLPPGQLTTPSATNAQPETPAPPQAETKSAPGGQSPNGANGINLNGKPVTKSPNTPAKKGKTAAQTPAASAATAAVLAPANNVPPTPAKQKTITVLEAYLQDLNATLKLSPTEKKEIETYYTQDGATEQNILSDASLSPLEQTQKVSDLRTERDGKIDALLGDPERQQEFARLEANYRVALTEAAAHGTLCPASASTPAAAPAPSSLTPGEAAPTPPANHPVE